MSKTSFASDGEELLYGFKKITLHNWQNPDLPTMYSGITSKFWIEHVMYPTLGPKVPEIVEMLFEIARGSMVYGWFYYPLITLALEQQFRVMETAAFERCKQCGISVTRPHKTKGEIDRSYSEILEILTAKKVISTKDSKRWAASRNLRNSRSHPRKPMILSPGEALQNLETTCELINKLFA